MAGVPVVQSLEPLDAVVGLLVNIIATPEVWVRSENGNLFVNLPQVKARQQVAKPVIEGHFFIVYQFADSQGRKKLYP